MIKFSKKNSTSKTPKSETKTMSSIATRRSTRTTRQPTRYDPTSKEWVPGSNNKYTSHEKIDNYDTSFDGNMPENIHMMINYKSGWAIKEDEDFVVDDEKCVKTEDPESDEVDEDEYDYSEEEEEEDDGPYYDDEDDDE